MRSGSAADTAACTRAIGGHVESASAVIRTRRAICDLVFIAGRLTLPPYGANVANNSPCHRRPNGRASEIKGTP